MATRENNAKHNRTEARFIKACGDGDLAVVEHTLTEAKYKADINAKNGQALCDACLYGHFEIVRFLLTSPTFMCDTNKINHALDLALISGELEIVKYLLTSTEVPIKAKIDHDNSRMFMSCFRRACKLTNSDLVPYLIFEHNVTPDMSLFKDDATRDYVESLVVARDLKNKLNALLEVQLEPKTKRMKI